MSAIVEMDARGLFCPIPVLRLQKGISQEAPGTRMKITCTDPGAMVDIPAWSRINGHRVISAEELGEEYILVVEKSANGA